MSKASQALEQISPSLGTGTFAESPVWADFGSFWLSFGSFSAHGGVQGSEERR